jgi:hypothetical protein
MQPSLHQIGSKPFRIGLMALTALFRPDHTGSLGRRVGHAFHHG